MKSAATILINALVPRLVEGSLLCPEPVVHWGKDTIWHMATEPFVTHTVECIPITPQHSVTVLPEVCKVSSRMSSNAVKIKIASTARLQGILWWLLPVFFFVVYIKWQRMHRQQFTLIIKCTQKEKYYDVRLWVNMLLLVWIPHWTNEFEVRHSTDSERIITQRYSSITAHYWLYI